MKSTYSLKKQPAVMIFILTFFWGLLVWTSHTLAEITVHDCSQNIGLPAVVRWARVLVDSSRAGHTQGISVAPAGDGTGAFLVTGSAWSDTNDDEYGLVIKMDQNGGILDSASYFDPDHENSLYDIQPSYNGSQILEGYISAGFKKALHKAPGDNNWWFESDAWLLKLDLSLDMVWQSAFGMQGDDRADTVLQNSDGYLFGGVLRDITTFYGGWLFQTDNDGAGVWSKSYYYYCSREDEKDDVTSDPCPVPNVSSHNDTDVAESVFSLLSTSDGGYISGADSRMVKFDSEVNEAWTVFEPGAAVIETSDDFLGAGIKTMDLTSPAIGLTRISAAGEVLWNPHYGRNAENLNTEFSPTINRNGLGLVEAADGGYLVAGQVEMYEAGSTGLWLIKTRPGTEGELDWALDFPGMRLHSVRPVLLTDDGDLIMVGSIACDDITRMLVIRVGVAGLQAPDPEFSMTPGAPYCVDQEITFDGSASSDPDGTVQTYEWKFGDGTVLTGPIVTHRYTHPGDYTVELKVRDNDGLPAFEHRTVTVGLPGVLWERTYANTQGCLDQTSCVYGVRAYDIIKGVDGGFSISGRSNFQYDRARYDTWLVKTFDNGVLHWQKNLTNDPNILETSYALDATPDNGYVITGTFLPYGEDWPATRAFLIKTDSLGNPAWHRIFGNDAGNNFYSYGWDVLSLDSGDFLVGGHTIQGSPDTAMWLLRTDSDGFESPGANWLFPPLNVDDYDSYCYAICPAITDGVVITGRHDTGRAVLPIIKTDADGDRDWTFYTNRSGYSTNSGFWVTAVDDGYIVAGSYFDKATVMKVRDNGSELAWSTQVPFILNSESCAYDGSLTPDGGVIITGWVRETSVGRTKIFAAKISGDGLNQWHQVFDNEGRSCYGSGVLALDDGSYLVLGDECQYYERRGCRSKLRKIGSQGGPVAAFNTDVREGTLPLEVQFSDLTSGGSAPYTYAWDFDDDGTVDSTEQNPVHTYNARGTYSVRLEVMDNAGASDAFVCEECVLAYFTGIYTGAIGVEITDFSVTDDADAEPETYDFQLAPEGLDEAGAFGFTLDATGPDGSHAFRITFPSPYDPGMILYKLPGWEEVPYTPVDAYTIEVVLDILDGELDPPFVLVTFLPLKSLTIGVEGSGTTDPAPGTHSYFVDNTVTIPVTAVPDTCWEFDYWSGAAMGTGNPVNIELNKYSGDTAITAHFKVSALTADYDCDRDVDGLDLAGLVSEAVVSLEEIEVFAFQFGSIE